jgi:hypothetical protein
VKELTFTFESETLASLFAERLKLYLKLNPLIVDIHVSVITPEDRIPEIERLARGSYASFKLEKELPGK